MNVQCTAAQAISHNTARICKSSTQAKETAPIRRIRSKMKLTEHEDNWIESWLFHPGPSLHVSFLSFNPTDFKKSRPIRMCFYMVSVSSCFIIFPPKFGLKAVAWPGSKTRISFQEVVLSQCFTMFHRVLKGQKAKRLLFNAPRKDFDRFSTVLSSKRRMFTPRYSSPKPCHLTLAWGF